MRKSADSTPEIIVFASGEGSLFRSIVEGQGPKLYRVALLVVSRLDCKAVAVAAELGVPVQSSAQFFAQNPPEADAFVLAGFLKKVPQTFTSQYGSRTLNTHPSLLPKFGGQGMYGSFVHEAVIAAGETESGFTVHLVNESYDEGKIVFQHRIKLAESETAQSLQDKVKSAERAIYPKVIADFLSN